MYIEHQLHCSRTLFCTVVSFLWVSTTCIGDTWPEIFVSVCLQLLSSSSSPCSSAFSRLSLWEPLSPPGACVTCVVVSLLSAWFLSEVFESTQQLGAVAWYTGNSWEKPWVHPASCWHVVYRCSEFTQLRAIVWYMDYGYVYVYVYTKG